MPNDQNPKAKKERLISELSAAENNADQVLKAGQDIVAFGQYLHDLAAAERQFVEIIPEDQYVSPKNWDAQTSSWSVVNTQLGQLRDSIDTHDTEIQFTLSYTAASTSGFVSPTTCSAQLPIEYAKSIESAVERYSQVLHSGEWSKKAEKELQRFGLDEEFENRRNPIEQIRAAELAYFQPSGKEPNPAAVLIPLREAIETTLAELLRRRPRQEPAKSWNEKILSIGRQCTTSGLSESDFNRLACEVCEIIDKLSGSKQQKILRHELRILLDRGLSFLVAFLRAIDHSRLNR